MAYRGEGDFFGEPCLLEGGPREEMAEAMDASTTVEVAREVLDELLRNDGGAAYKFARALIARRKDLETRVEQLIFKDVGAKLAELLLSLGQEHGIAGSARAGRGPQDHAPGDGEPDRLDARDRLADALAVQAQGPDPDRGPQGDPRGPRRSPRVSLGPQGP